MATLTNAKGPTPFNSLLTITYDQWSSAATHCYIENMVAQGHPDRVLVSVTSIHTISHG